MPNFKVQIKDKVQISERKDFDTEAFVIDLTFGI